MLKSLCRWCFGTVIDDDPRDGDSVSLTATTVLGFDTTDERRRSLKRVGGGPGRVCSCGCACGTESRDWAGSETGSDEEGEDEPVQVGLESGESVILCWVVSSV